MKTVTNKTLAPLQVPLPGGKTLRLGPGMAGQIRDGDADHGPIQQLVKAGDIEISAGTRGASGGQGRGVVPSGGPGHGRLTPRQNRGDR